MQTINLVPVPNQSFTVTINGILWELTIKVANQVMAADIIRDRRLLVAGSRILADTPIIPYEYLSTEGNFAIITPNGEIPWWKNFGDTHTLVYLTAEEVGARRD